MVRRRGACVSAWVCVEVHRPHPVVLYSLLTSRAERGGAARADADEKKTTRRETDIPVVMSRDTVAHSALTAAPIVPCSSSRV